MNNEMQKKLEALFEDPDTVREVFVEDAEQTLANLAARGIDMSREELAVFAEGVVKGLGLDEEGELSEDALENVAGGKTKFGFGFFKGFSDGLGDANKGEKNKPVGGLLYKIGYGCGQAIGNGGR